jgi:predicted signal transduction protein with EAL and GGDEF domain
MRYLLCVGIIIGGVMFIFVVHSGNPILGAVVVLAVIVSTAVSRPFRRRFRQLTRQTISVYAVDQTPK